MIDKNGPAPKGTGIKQLRENIAESKLSYEIMDDAAQAFLKTKIMDNIEKYFYMICFTGYLREQSRIAKDGVTEEEKKQFALAGGKGMLFVLGICLSTELEMYVRWLTWLTRVLGRGKRSVFLLVCLGEFVCQLRF